MRFLCLVYDEEWALEAVPEGGLDSRGSSTHPEWVRTARTGRNRTGELSVTDGPFAETKEQLGGFQACRLDSRLPGTPTSERSSSS